MERVIITIARGFGSGGKAIAVELSNQLGIPCYEKEILTMASEQSGISEELFYARNEKLKGSLLVNYLKSIPIDYVVEPMDKKFTHDNNLFNIQRQIIEDLADTQSCIIVGKCADNILSGRNNVLKVFIDAPMKECIKSLKQRLNVDENEAIRLINKTNKYRSDYYQYYTGGKDWHNPINYDICLNTGFLERKICVELIKAAIELKRTSNA